MQRRTRMRVLVYHSPSARTRLSVSFNGLKLELERKFIRAVRQTKNENKCTYYTQVMEQMNLLPCQLVQDLVGRLLLIIVNISGVSFLSRDLRGKSVYTPFSLNFFNR